MLKLIYKKKDPKYLIITPLKIGDKIPSETKISVKRNKLSFAWYSYEGNGNVVENFQSGLNLALKNHKDIKYVIKLDTDTVWNRNTLDNMYYSLKKGDTNIAYSYCGFEFVGSVNHHFPLTPFIPEKLKQANYISSNSMFKISVIKGIPLITDNKYKRLLDWAYLLVLLNNGYIGTPCKGYFVAVSKQGSVSSGSIEDYKLKYERVKKDFIK